MTEIILKINPASGIIINTAIIASDLHSHSWGINRLQFFQNEIERFAEQLFVKVKQEQVARAIQREYTNRDKVSVEENSEGKNSTFDLSVCPTLNP